LIPYHGGMKRKHLHAAEVFGYGYQHYEDRLGIVSRIMPEDGRPAEDPTEDAS
jgi:hypothetical protein